MRTSQGLLLCGLLLVFILPSNTAHASEKKMMGDVVVEQYQSIEEISTAWGNVRVDGEVEGDVKSGFGDIEVNGPVGGDVDAGFGNVIIDAPVGGDVEAGFGDLSLKQGAQIDGNIYLGHGTIEEDEAAQRHGPHTVGMASGFEDEEGLVGTVSDVIGWAVGTLVLVAAAVLLAVIVPGPLRAAARNLEYAPVRSLVLGFASVPAAFVLAVLLGITVVGLPLTFLLLVACVAVAIFGLFVTAYALGRKAVLAAGRHRAGDALAATVGAILVALVLLIPFLGGLIFVVLALLGAGAAISALLAWRRRPRGVQRTTYASYEDYLRERGAE